MWWFSDLANAHAVLPSCGAANCATAVHVSLPGPDSESEWTVETLHGSGQ